METIATVLDSGADLNMQRNDSRTAYALAMLGGQMQVAALLEARGAKTDLSALDQFVVGTTSANSKELDRLTATQPEVMTPGNQRLVPDLTMGHRTSAVRALLAVGLPVDARGEMGRTALHWACWKGYANLVQRLLDHGASLTTEDEQFHGTPPGWFGHGVRNCDEVAGDYAQVTRIPDHRDPGQSRESPLIGASLSEPRPAAGDVGAVIYNESETDSLLEKTLCCRLRGNRAAHQGAKPMTW